MASLELAEKSIPADKGPTSAELAAIEAEAPVDADLNGKSTALPVDLYKDVNAKYPLLTPEGEVELAKELVKQEHNPAKYQIAFDQFVCANLRLVIRIAHRQVREGAHLKLDDLIQEGNIGLMIAVKRFDHTRGTRFSTYATWWIRSAMFDARANKESAIRWTEDAGGKYRKVAKAQRKLAESLGRSPTPEEIANHLGMKLKKVNEILEFPKTDLKLDKKTHDDSEVTRLDQTADVDVPTPLDELIDGSLSDAILRIINDPTLIKPKRAAILKYRFALEGKGAHTIEETALEFDKTKDSIRQNIEEAAKIIREQLILRDLID